MLSESNKSIRRTTRPGFAVTLIAGVIWFSVVVSGLAVIFVYSSSPGPAGAIPLRWPVESRIKLDAGRPTLVMFAHPQCPCTRASVGELERLMTDCQGRLAAQVWFIKPEGVTGDWTNTDLWRKASAIPGVSVHCDEGCSEARRFHAGTSGQSALYDQKGNLLFQGGITISRGHSGDNPGRAAVTALVLNEPFRSGETPVFGCELFDNQCPQTQGDAVCQH